MQASIQLSVGLGCVWGLSSLGYAADAVPPNIKSITTMGRASVDTPSTVSWKSPGSISKSTVRPTRRIIRAQNEAANEFEMPPATGRGTVIPPPEPPRDADALKRLRDRSAKARWDQLHEEWLRARKNRNAEPEPMESQSPAAEESAEVEKDADPANPFEPVPVGDPPPASDLTPPVPSLNERVQPPNVRGNPVLLQAQPKPGEKLPTVEDVNKFLNEDNGERLPPPVRDPSELPKISEILPNPDIRTEAGSRPVPELKPDLYVKLGNKVPFMERSFPEMRYTFEATNVYSNPLYFEDAPLERYGHSYPPLLQPIASVAKFGAQVVFLPYQMTINPLCSKVYPLGWYGPGECVPYRLYPVPWNAKAAGVQAATILGVGYVTP